MPRRVGPRPLEAGRGDYVVGTTPGDYVVGTTSGDYGDYVYGNPSEPRRAL